MTGRIPLYALVLFASWNFNLLGIPDSVQCSRCETRTGYLGTEAPLVLFRMNHPELHPLHPLPVDAAAESRPYLSQFGLQGIVFTASGAGPAATSAVCALLSALVFAMIFASAQRDLGAPTGDTACALAALTPVCLTFAPALYWATFLMLLPFALVWCFGGWASTPGRKAALLLGVGAAVYLKCLCGYEYVTSVIAAPLAAAWFHMHRIGVPARTRILVGASLFAAGVAGFALALGTHALQVECVVGENGIAVIRDRAVARTAAAPEESHLAAERNGRTAVAFAVQCFKDYFRQRAISLPSAFGASAFDLSLGTASLLAAAYAIAAVVRPSRDRLALAGALAIGFAASVSWQVLAVNHMCVHRHLNMIVYAVPFLPLFGIAMGHASRVAGRHCGMVLLAGLVLAMIWNMVHESSNGSPAGKVQGRVEAREIASSVAPSLLVEWDLFDVATGGPSDPGAVLVRGWAVGDPDRTCSLEARAGDVVLPSRTIWYRRPDIDYASHRPVHRGMFVLVVSNPTAASVEVFADGQPLPDSTR
jgi:hypothetical protein